MRKYLIVLLVLLVSACGFGAPNVYTAKEKAHTIDSITIDRDFKDAYTMGVLSNCASQTMFCKYVQNDKYALMWFGDPGNVYAVIEFMPVSKNKSKVTFYDYAGQWGFCMIKIKEVISSDQKGSQ